MAKLLGLLVGVPLLTVAAFSSSSTYQLNSYGIGPGGTSNSSSSTYHLQGSAGEQANGSSSGSTLTSNNGSVQTEQLNIPQAPTLGNGSGTYYNKLSFVISTGSNPSDTIFSIAVSTNGFVTINYVQADGTLGASPVYQTYTAWGGASGSFMTGLDPSTTYQAKVDAMQGMFTNTEYGAAASASTVAPSITFSLSPNSTTLSNLLPGTVVTSSSLAIGFATNGVAGGGVYISGLNTGLLSATQSHTIAAFTGNLSTASEGFGAQVTSPTQASGGPFLAVTPFNGSGSVVGADSTVPQQILASSAPVVGGTASANVQAKASNITPAGSDYQETLTFIAAASF